MTLAKKGLLKGRDKEYFVCNPVSAGRRQAVSLKQKDTKTPAVPAQSQTQGLQSKGQCGGAGHMSTAVPP